MTAKDPNRLVRPYLITGGRTRPADELPLEALVETTPAAADAGDTLQFEPRRVLELCRGVVSVAEVAAALAVPLGVARVLVSDLATDGYVRVHRTATTDGPDIPLLERLLDALHAC